MMKLYLTTSVASTDPAIITDCVCHLWRVKPRYYKRKQRWFHSSGQRIFMGYYKQTDLSALGFPPPGRMRVLEIGEYKEDE